MSEKFTREYYRIRLPDNVGKPYQPEFYSSNNGTSEWGELKKVKAIITRGQPYGHRGQWSKPFDNYEIVRVTEVVERSSEVVSLEDKK